ncbi:hypothetical protein Taro_038918 [Colocasia esculenta]|uniref:Uncharacterized protein n=1 Tax=Colocasia esculenta TaxID=4460 RepID=A0A843WF62_COLES|nr:hypothetical protein [Colocasia esculenta]
MAASGAAITTVLGAPAPLRDRVAIVTGGNGGIGSAVCRHLASLGARVVVNYVDDPAAADDLVSAINAGYGGATRAVAVEADVSDEGQVRALFDAAARSFGPTLHILVTTAAVMDASYPSLADTTAQCFDRTFAVNARGTFLCCREAARRLVRGGGGRIVTFSSSGVGSLRPGYSAYLATKAAIETMTRILAKELRGTGITANTVAPGPTAAPLLYAGKTEAELATYTAEIPLGRVGQPEDVANVVAFLVSDAGEWINAQVVRANGGNV